MSPATIGPSDPVVVGIVKLQANLSPAVLPGAKEFEPSRLKPGVAKVMFRT